MGDPATALSLLMFFGGILLSFIIPAVMAANRGRSALGWIIITLIFSPLVSIIALMVQGPSLGKILADRRANRSRGTPYDPR